MRSTSDWSQSNNISCLALLSKFNAPLSAAMFAHAYIFLHNIICAMLFCT